MKLTINGREVEAKVGANLLTTARENGIFIPAICYLSHCSPTMACRLCAVEVDGKRVFACATKIKEDMREVVTSTPEIESERREIMESYCVNHPLECGVCDKSGECELQDYALFLGVDGQKYAIAQGFAAHDSWARASYDPNLCIMCERCVTTCKENLGEANLKAIKVDDFAQVDGAKWKESMPKDALAVWSRRQKGVIGFVGENPCFDCCECVSVCPVGALVVGEIKYRANAWELDKTASTCCHCAMGCGVVYETQRADTGESDAHRHCETLRNAQSRGNPLVDSTLAPNASPSFNAIDCHAMATPSLAMTDSDGKWIATPLATPTARNDDGGANRANCVESPNAVIASDAQYREPLLNPLVDSTLAPNASPSLNAIDCHAMATPSLAMTDSDGFDEWIATPRVATAARNDDAGTASQVDCHAMATPSLAMTDSDGFDEWIATPTARNDDSTFATRDGATKQILRVTNDYHNEPICSAGRFGFHLQSSARPKNDINAAICAFKNATHINIGSDVTNEEAALLDKISKHLSVPIINEKIAKFGAFWGEMLKHTDAIPTKAQLLESSLFIAIGCDFKYTAPALRYALNNKLKNSKESSLIYAHPLSDKLLDSLSKNVKHAAYKPHELLEFCVNLESQIELAPDSKIALILGQECYLDANAKQIAKTLGEFAKNKNAKVIIIPNGPNYLGIALNCAVDSIKPSGNSIGFRTKGDFVLDSNMLFENTPQNKVDFVLPSHAELQGSITNAFGESKNLNNALDFFSSDIADIAYALNLTASPYLCEQKTKNLAPKIVLEKYKFDGVDCAKINPESNAILRDTQSQFNAYTYKNPLFQSKAGVYVSAEFMEKLGVKNGAEICLKTQDSTLKSRIYIDSAMSGEFFAISPAVLESAVLESAQAQSKTPESKADSKTPTTAPYIKVEIQKI